VKHPIRQMAHFGVATFFARVVAKSVGKANYLLKRPHDAEVEGTRTEVALSHARE
jgi:hypothetical protein